ncbi:PP2Cc [Musa troglodytarum]|uniref:protein-serine/threonine phosphatase n=1 Tax=Musa troglodytarum TaxID=320322 RepID=A0A9E7GNU5_9LILI|nr:PP2Cc [Musa troglodytarum]
MGGCCSRDEVGRMPTCGAMEQVDAFYAAEEESVRVGDGGARVRLKGSCMVASMFTQQGWKGVNQDAMTVWEGFAGDQDTVFCGAFDGHGPYGHRVACHVRDALPSRLQSGMKAFEGGADDTAGDGWFASWKASIVSAFEELDKELSNHPWIDCICSGATAVTILKEIPERCSALETTTTNLFRSSSRWIRNPIFRVSCSKCISVCVSIGLNGMCDSSGEAERIRSCRGRVFSLEEEPDVHRLWLPDEDSPGLAMARAFGDFCLKDFGLIATPQISHRKLSEKDEFVVLATDGVRTSFVQLLLGLRLRLMHCCRYGTCCRTRR